MTRLSLLLACALAALAAAPAVSAHKGGKAEPRISAKTTGKGFYRTVVVRLKDVDSGKPIEGADVTVYGQMTRPHLMSLIERNLRDVSGGTYRGPYTFIMPGDWTAHIEVTGKNVVKANADLAVPIGAGASGPGATNPPPIDGGGALPTRLETNVTGRDYLSMLMLFLHSGAAVGWIVGVILMAVALSTEPLLAGGVRARIASAYRRWGVWAHWALVPVIVATGVYNMVYVTPFVLRWPWSDDLDGVPYGGTYEAILFVKLALFVVLLATGTLLLARIVRAPARAASPAVAHGSAEPVAGPIRTLLSALGAAGVLYVLTVPLILAAAMALRYVHILSHVAEVVNSR